MKTFAVIYFIMVFVLMVAWPLVGGILPEGVPGDTMVLVGETKVHILYGTSLITTSLIMIFLWAMGRL